MRARTDGVRRLVRLHHPEAAQGEALTEREVHILRLLQGALSLTEIADEIYLSANTVKTHARAIYRKLGVHSRSEAVLAARQQGLM